jgi:hypothetical protein
VLRAFHETMVRSNQSLAGTKRDTTNGSGKDSTREAPIRCVKTVESARNVFMYTDTNQQFLHACVVPYRTAHRALLASSRVGGRSTNRENANGPNPISILVERPAPLVERGGWRAIAGAFDHRAPTRWKTGTSKTPVPLRGDSGKTKESDKCPLC